MSKATTETTAGAPLPVATATTAEVAPLVPAAVPASHPVPRKAREFASAGRVSDEEAQGQRTCCMGVADGIFLLALFSSLPLLLPLADYLHFLVAPLTGDFSLALPTENPSFLWTMALAAMFAGLAMLFVCLMKTAYAMVGLALASTGTASYLLGYALLAFLAFTGYRGPSMLFDLAGALVGFGLCVQLFMVVRSAGLGDLHKAFRLITLLVGGAVLVNALLLVLDMRVGMLVLLALACVGSLGVFRSFLRCRKMPQTRVRGTVNWWDVFGHLDAAAVDDTGLFSGSFGRLSLFVILPLTMLLLFVTQRDLSRQFAEGVPFALISLLLAFAIAVPPLLFSSSRSLTSFFHQLYLPGLAFLVLAAGSLAPSLEVQRTIISTGTGAFCMLYLLFMGSTLIAMAGRMESLALPVASIMVIALAVGMLLSYTHLAAVALESFTFPLLVILLVLTFVLLLATPATRLLHMITKGVAAVAEREASEPGTVPLEERCAELAQLHGLTAREAEILLYLGRGHTSAYVAEVLVVAESTIRTHRKNIYRKLGVTSRETLFALLDAEDYR